MAAKGGGISGVAVALATAGGLLVYMGIQNVPLAEGLRDLLRGKVPTPRPKKATPVPAEFVAGHANADPNALAAMGGTALGTEIAGYARQYLGTPYVWAGHTPAGFDCSGFATWVLHHDVGLNLPNNTHTVTGQFLTWTGATVIPFNQMAAGDLVVWPAHMGIAVDNQSMIHAPQPGESVKISKVWRVPDPQIMRVKSSTLSRLGG